MMRRSVLFLLSVCFILTLGQGVADACTDVAKCDVERTCTKTDDGMKCVVKAKGETTVDAVRACMRNHVGDHKMDGVTVNIEDVEGGVQIVMKASTPEALAALRAHSGDCCAKAEGCAKAKTACCDKAETAGCDKAKTACCDKAKTADCAKAKTTGCAKAAPAKNEGCDKAAPAKQEGCSKTAAAKPAGCEAKDCAADCAHAKQAEAAKTTAKPAGCEDKDCADDCPHAKAAAATAGCAHGK